MHLEMVAMSVLVGMMAGWLAGLVMKGGGRRGKRGLPNPGGSGGGTVGTTVAAFVGAALMIVLQRKVWPAQPAHA